MANTLGYVSETGDGFEGTLAMMTFSAAIRIEKNAAKTADNQPDFRILAGDHKVEIGSGWNRTARISGRAYVSLTLSDPQLGPHRIYANLIPVRGRTGRHVILWKPGTPGGDKIPGTNFLPPDPRSDLPSPARPA